jgi:hypothetical protein
LPISRYATVYKAQGWVAFLLSHCFYQPEEIIMNVADMLIHVHPELDVPARSNLERRLASCSGVDCAEFNHHAHPHALIVKFDPDTVDGMKILGMVRNVDPVATIVGL